MMTTDNEHQFHIEAVSRLLEIDRATAAVLVEMADERRNQSEHKFQIEVVARLLDIDPATAAVLVDIADERRRQIEVYQRDRHHDDQHSLAEWGWLLATRAVAISCPFPEEMVAPDPARLLLEHAAVAAAALESRRRQLDEEKGDPTTLEP